MYEFYGFDPKTLSNDELFDKQLLLTTKKLMAARFGKVDAVNQLQMMINAIDFERRERMFDERIGSVWKAAPSVVVETDGDLLVPVVEDTKKTTKSDRVIRRAIRTSKPITP